MQNGTINKEIRKIVKSPMRRRSPLLVAGEEGLLGGDRVNVLPQHHPRDGDDDGDDDDDDPGKVWGGLEMT